MESRKVSADMDTQKSQKIVQAGQSLHEDCPHEFGACWIAAEQEAVRRLTADILRW
jgi:hypothetical protein